MGVKINKIEYYLPERVVNNKDIFFSNEINNENTQIDSILLEKRIKKLEKSTGIKERHVASKNETALDLALTAGKKVLDNYDKDKIDFLILCTESPEYYLPHGSGILQDKLDLKKDIGAFDYNLGCSGFIYGLVFAKSLIYTDIANNVLLISSDTYSKYINPKDKANRSIFGDAATATIIEKSEEEQIGKFVLGTDGSGYKNLIVPNGGLRNRYNPNAEEIDDGAGNIRTENNFYMNGPEVFNFTIKVVPKLFLDILKENKTNLEDLDYVIFHQANKYINEYLRKKISIPEEKYCIDLLHTGNTVSNTIPIAIKNSLDNKIIKKDDKVLLAGFGVGYSWGGTIITI